MCVHKSLQKENEDPKKLSGLKASELFKIKKAISCERVIRQSILGRGQQVMRQWLGNIRGKLMADKGYFSRFVYTGSFQCWLPALGEKGVLLLQI